MATTVGQHQQGAFSTPINGTNADASVVLSNDNTLRGTYNAHDVDPGIHVQSGTALSQGAAGTAGRKWIVTDALPSPVLQYDTGATWLTVGTAAAAIQAGTFAGNYVFSGTVNFTGAVSFNTTIATSFVATTDDAVNLGAPAKRWAAIYASGGLFGDISGAIDASAALEIFSATKALLLSRVDPSTVVTPVNGMIIYNTVTDKFQGRAAGSWVDLH